MPGIRKDEGEKDVTEEEDEVRRFEHEVMRAILTEPFQQMGRSWDCSQMEDELEEKYAMDWHG